MILLVPMLVIVPFSAFRSLAAEREDGTFELLSITALNARQIVSGKLGSAVLQMIVYYSALGPCIAFTYLLRGIDILTILLLLYYAFLLSMLLSALGLLVATASRSRHWQVLLSVALVIALVVADIFASWAGGAVIWVGGSIPYDDVYFWLIQLAVLMFCISYLVLFLLSAAAQISFASDNRSTKLRVVLVVQHLLWVFWMTFLWIEARENDVLFGIVPFGSIHWFLAGALISGESGRLSPRIRRTLPQSMLGRMCGTWFNPGSGTGYIFAVVSHWSLVVVTVAATIAGAMTGFSGSNVSELITMSTLAGAYVTIYLGVGRFIILAMKQVIHTGLVLPLLLHIVIAALGAIVPAVLGGWIQGFNNLDYTPLQLSNWAWTLVEAGDGDIWGTPSVPIALYVGAGLMLTANLLLAIREVEQTRLLTPSRVVEDELLLHPERAPQPKSAASPWDEPGQQAADSGQ
jgi:hypothetical protein